MAMDDRAARLEQMRRDRKLGPQLSQADKPRTGYGFLALFAGSCADCGGDITVSQWIQRTDDGYAHVACPDVAA